MSQPPFLLSQQGLPSVPSSSDLGEATLWDYRFELYFAGGTSFEVVYNETKTTSYTMELLDAGGIAQIRVTASSGSLPLILIPETTLVPTDGVYRYRWPDGNLLTFEEAVGTERHAIVMERLAVLDVQSARAVVQGVTFPQPLIPFIENTEQIGIGSHPATIAAHLTSLLRLLLGNSPFASQPAAIQVRYAYVIGGVPVEAPVLLLARQDIAIGFDDQLIEQIAAAIRQWLDAVQPPPTEARLLFGFTFWSAAPRTDAHLLRLANVSLPMTDVV